MNSRLTRTIIIAVAIGVVAVTARIVGLTREPFYIDEICSVRFCSGNTGRILEINARDVHPPLYYLGLAKWRGLFGRSESSIRGYSVMWSLIGLGALSLLTRDLTGSGEAAMMAAILAAIHPLDIYFAQEARMYAQFAALATLSSWMLWRWLSSTEVRRFGWPLGYSVLSVFLLYTHYLSVTILFAQGVFAVLCFSWSRRWESFAAYLGIAVAAAGAFFPWMNYVRSFRGGLYSANHLSWMTVPRLWDGFGIFTGELFWGYVWLRLPWSAVSAVIAACIIVFLVFFMVHALLRPNLELSKNGESNWRYLKVVYPAWLLIGPLMIAILISTAYHPVFFAPRFSVLVLPPFLVLLVFGVAALGRVQWRWLFLLGMASLMIVASVVQAVQLAKAGMPEFAVLWGASEPPDRVVFFPRYQAKVASYYIGKKRIRSASRQEIEELGEGGGTFRIWVCSDPQFPWRDRFEDRKYRNWLLNLGPHRHVATVDGIDVFEVKVVQGSSLDPG